jgi:leader peptidase (prepilin peptidase)/N-methyltransferase
MRLLAFGLFGLLGGSFLTVLIHRLPAREEMVRGRSRCPRCGATIRAIDNIPIVSWILLGGRCRSCGNRISAEYPLVEATTAGLFVAAGAVFDPLEVAVGGAVFISVMLAVGLIDARHRIVPNRIVYPALIVFGGAIAVGDLAGSPVDLGTAGIGLALYAIPLFVVAFLVPGGMGMGDVKLAGLIGLALGSLGLSYVGVAAGVGIIGGGLGAVLAMAFLKYGRKQQIPFGPFLAAGAIVATLVGPQIADLYLRLTGLG